MAIITVLQVVQWASLELGLPQPSTVVGNPDVQVQQLLALLRNDGNETRDLSPWPQLTKEHSFTLTSGQDSYPLPADFNFQLYTTNWDQTRHWQLVGPLSPMEWQSWKSGITSVTPQRLYRIKGWKTNQFFIHPVPGASDDGATMVFEYQSLTWVRPRTWVTGTVYAANAYVSYNGNIYLTSAGGTAGATPPTHTSSSASDGGVTWVYQSPLYININADTDTSLIDDFLHIMGLKWRWRQARGLEYAHLKQEWQEALRRKITHYKGAKELSIVTRDWPPPFIGPWSVPDSGFGS